MRILSVIWLFLISSLAWSSEDMRAVASKCGARQAKSISGLANGQYFVMYEGENSQSRYAICDTNDDAPVIYKEQSEDALWKLHAREINKFSSDKISKINELKIWGNSDIKAPFTDDPELVELELLGDKNTDEEIGIYFGNRVKLVKNIQSLPENVNAVFELNSSDELNNLAYALLYKGLIVPSLLSSASELMDSFIDSEYKVEDGKKVASGMSLISPSKFFKMSNEEKKAVLDKMRLALSGINYETCAWQPGSEPMIFGDKRENGCGQLCSGTLNCQNFLKEPINRVSVCSADKCQNSDIASAKGMMACTRDPAFNKAVSAPAGQVETRIWGAMVLSPKSSASNCSGICVGLATGLALDLEGVNTRMVTCSPDNCGKSAKACLADVNFFSKEVNVESVASRKMKLDTYIEAEANKKCPGEASVGCQGQTQSE